MFLGKQDCPKMSGNWLGMIRQNSESECKAKERNGLEISWFDKVKSTLRRQTFTISRNQFTLEEGPQSQQGPA